MNKWKIAIAAVGAVLFIAWYAFRPERLFINERVHETLPTANVSSIQAVESGVFYGIAHPTGGTATIYRMGDGALMLRFTDFRIPNAPTVQVTWGPADAEKDSKRCRPPALSI